MRKRLINGASISIRNQPQMSSDGYSCPWLSRSLNVLWCQNLRGYLPLHELILRERNILILHEPSHAENEFPFAYISMISIPLNDHRHTLSNATFTCSVLQFFSGQGFFFNIITANESETVSKMKTFLNPSLFPPLYELLSFYSVKEFRLLEEKRLFMPPWSPRNM